MKGPKAIGTILVNPSTKSKLLRQYQEIWKAPNKII